MILKSGHGSLLTKIISTSSFEQEVTLKKWICELENLQVKVGMNLIPGEPTVDRTYYIYFTSLSIDAGHFYSNSGGIARNMLY